jgi:hypothetical protein
MTNQEKVDTLKKAKSNGKAFFVMANYDGIINCRHYGVGDVISCHKNHELAEKSKSGRSSLTRICDIEETLYYWDI